MKWLLLTFFTLMISVAYAAPSVDNYGAMVIEQNLAPLPKYTHALGVSYVMDSAFEDIYSLNYSFQRNESYVSYGILLSKYTKSSNLSQGLANNISAKTISPDKVASVILDVHLARGVGSIFNYKYFSFLFDLTVSYGRAKTQDYGDQTIYSWGGKVSFPSQSKPGFFSFGVKQTTLMPGDLLEQNFNEAYLAYNFSF